MCSCLTGAHGHFCSGADLNTVEDDEFVAALGRVLRGLRAAPFPTMAVVEGFALGAGTQLAIACDLRTATPDAGFGVPAAKLGLMVDQWTVRRLAALAGQSTARHVLLSTDVVSGERAHQLGLVHRLGDTDDGLGWAERIAELAPLTLTRSEAGSERGRPRRAGEPGLRRGVRRGVGQRGSGRGPGRLRREAATALRGSLSAQRPEPRTEPVSLPVGSNARQPICWIPRARCDALGSTHPTSSWEFW